MHISRTLVIVTFALVPAAAGAQSPQAAASASQQPVQPTGTQPPTQKPAADQPGDVAVAGERSWAGSFDFGVRGSSVSGDRGRFERYRDLGDGVFLETLRLNREHNGILYDIAADHVGRRDQRYAADVVRPGKLRAAFLWDQIPMLLSQDTRTLFTGLGTGVLAIDDALQAQGQANPGALTDLFKSSSVEFVTRTRRHIADGAVEYLASDALSFTATARRTDRSGTIPFGGSFGHSSMVELPAPTEHNLSEFDAGAEYARDRWLLRAGSTGSWFHNDVTSVVFDNPFRSTDLASTPSRGRLSLAPSNSLFGVNGMASVRLPYRSRLTAYGSVGMLKDAGDPLIPQTINTAFTTAPLERSTVEGEARLSTMSVNFVSRPRRFLDVTMRYRSHEYDNRTPEFTLAQRVSYDNTPAAVSPPIHSEPFGVLRSSLDADLRVTPRGMTSVGVGYTHLTEDRTHRIFESTTDHQVRLMFDAITQQWFSVRTKYEHAQRRGEGLDITELIAIGEQPGMRHFDIASRDRNRVTVIGSVTPTGFLTTSLSVAAGKDDYLESEFGLRDNTHRVYSAGADLVANDRLNFGLSYSYEKYDALSRSRQANPGPQFTDPSRNWAADTSDRTHSVILNANVLRIAEKVDLRLSYDFNNGRARYNYITGPVADRTLPEEVILPTTLPTPTALPSTLSELQRGTADAVYSLTSRLSLGVSYWYERYRVNDFTLDIDANPDLVRGQALLIGYLYRPYTANMGWVRLIYAW
jgi:MtrB/PioB family decaheme-associated outer membrane protein